ncbi:hypothetical protein [Gilliamella sp. Bif1-4]|uniref:hypothetical protein n=1 Tax=Gilliamella sp. Bif1-4 TaxID=3120233 RepID=UPI00114747E7|nr:hypothetical protein [Gilliamella apicola]
MLVLALLLLSLPWNNVQANDKKYRAGNRSDAIILLSEPLPAEPVIPVIKYARPNLQMGDGKHAGPANIWNPKKGFLVQSTNPGSYNLNFPTTGADNLYFDLLITGIDVRELTWAPVSHEGITASVINVVPNDYWIPYEDRGQVVARVKLTGPEARNQRFNPSRITVPRLPQTFELVGRDKDGYELVKYGFVLRKWFVNRVVTKYYNDQSAWCRGLGYRMPGVSDLTNTNCGVRGDHFFPCIKIKVGRDYIIMNDGAKPSSGHGEYQRQIGAGFFTEWGSMRSYADAGFIGNSYWLGGSRSGDTMMYAVDSGKGYVYKRGDNLSGNYGLCLSGSG